MSEHHFYHNGFGYTANLENHIVDWDEDDENGIPTEGDINAASVHWDDFGFNEYMSELEDNIGNMKYERWRDDRWGM